MRELRLLAGIVIGLLLVSCSTTPNPQTLSIPEVGLESAYPSSPESKIIISGGYPGSNALSHVVGEFPKIIIEPSAPTSGKASISGAIFSYTNNFGVANVPMFLTYVEEGEELKLPANGPDQTKGDIEGQIGATGEFQIKDIPPGKYYILISSTLSWTPVVDTSTDAYTPILFTFEADQSYPLGVLQVSWP